MAHQAIHKHRWLRPIPRRADSVFWLASAALMFVLLFALPWALLQLARDRVAGGAPAASRPVSQPAAPSGRDWPAFQGGGALLGVAVDAPAPPLKLRWTFKAEAEIEGAAAIVDGIVYVGDIQGNLYAVNLKDGTQCWRHKTKNGFLTSPLVHDGRVLIGDDAGVFHAVSAGTGEPLWQVKTEAEIHSSANLVDGKIVFGSYDNHLYCVDPKRGEVVWKRESGNYVHCTPAVSAGLVYVAGCDETLSVVDAADGDVIDTADLKGYAAAAPLPLDDVVVGATLAGSVRAFDALDLSEKWAYEVEDGDFFSSPAYAAGRIVIGGRDGKVHAIDAATGKKAWTFTTRGDVDSSPAIGGGRVYVGGKDGKMYVLDLKTGRRLWAFDAGRPISASPAIASGVVVIGDAGGRLYCLERKK